MLAEAEAQRAPDELLPLKALRSDDSTEALFHRVERMFKMRMREDLETRWVEDMTKFFRWLLHGENPGPNYPIPPDMERQRAVFTATRDPALLDAGELAVQWIAGWKKQLGID